MRASTSGSTSIASKSKTGASQTIGSLRMHESAGEVHFHDDKRKLKVAVPVAEWHDLLAKALHSGETSFTYIDQERETLLKVEVTVGRKHDVDVELTIESATVGADLAKLLKFTYGG